MELFCENSKKPLTISAKKPVDIRLGSINASVLYCLIYLFRKKTKTKQKKQMKNRKCHFYILSTTFHFHFPDIFPDFLRELNLVEEGQNPRNKICTKSNPLKVSSCKI